MHRRRWRCIAHRRAQVGDANNHGKDVRTAKDANDSKAGTTNGNEAGASEDTKGKAGTTAGARETPAGAKKPIFQPPSGWVPDGHNLHGDPVLKEHLTKVRAWERATGQKYKDD